MEGIIETNHRISQLIVRVIDSEHEIKDLKKRLDILETSFQNGRQA